jgi:hypothetical protein
MADGDLASMMAGAQPSALLDYAVNPSGFDFGMSQPKTGLGYGLLGDTSSLASSESCTDCAPTDPCTNCTASDDGDDQGRIVKTQAIPMPPPSFFPPMPPMTTPAHPAEPPIIGDPNAWWNRPLDDNFSWAGCPTEEQRQARQDVYDTDMIDCKTVYAVKGARHGKACEQRAFDKYVDCVHNDGQKGIQPYWRQGSS